MLQIQKNVPDPARGAEARPQHRNGPTEKIWHPAKFKRADKFDGAIETSGYSYRGLGLQMSIAQSPKGRRSPVWLLIHLNSGHVICQISGVVAKALPIAAEIAECTDWGFFGLDGWNNTDPDLPSKVKNFAKRYPKHIISIRGTSDRVIAEQISAERALHDPPNRGRPIAEEAIAQTAAPRGSAPLPPRNRGFPSHTAGPKTSAGTSQCCRISASVGFGVDRATAGGS